MQFVSFRNCCSHCTVQLCITRADRSEHTLEHPLKNQAVAKYVSGMKLMYKLGSHRDVFLHVKLLLHFWCMVLQIWRWYLTESSRSSWWSQKLMLRVLWHCSARRWERLQLETNVVSADLECKFSSVSWGIASVPANVRIDLSLSFSLSLSLFFPPPPPLLQ